MKTDRYTSWYNENEGRAYPLRDDVTQLDDSGLSLPTDILADLCVVVPPAHTGVRLSSVRITATLVTVAVCSDTLGLLVGTFPIAGIEAYRAYPLTPLTPNVTGWVVFGSHQATSLENYRFATAEQSALTDRAVRYIAAPAVTDFIRAGGSSTQVATGLVRLLPGSGILIEQDPLDAQNIIVRLDPALKDKLSGPCNAAAGLVACKVPPIRRLNGVPADPDGTITLRFE